MRSKGPRLQVGCVIVHRKSLRILSAGYNGFPPGTPNKDENWEKKAKHTFVVHAEANAVLLAGQADLEGSIAIVAMFPCRECAKMLIAKGVRKVYYLSSKDIHQEESTAIFKAAKVEVVGEDETLKNFEEDLIQKVRSVLQNTTPGEPEGFYKGLRDSTEEPRSIFKEKKSGRVQLAYILSNNSNRLILYFTGQTDGLFSVLGPHCQHKSFGKPSRSNLDRL
ncbi:unnamed protein product [Pocillopora meandrina]|uniref:dCMP deaminase n=1 Tax=Pocillopora meandrina TaxID=46732 RepID=A0AAU9X0L6_9CNID|nr:unnamed protein product [Pocillopora meandrina]